MRNCAFLAAALMLLGGFAFAEHAVPVEPDDTSTVVTEPTTAAPSVAPAPQPAPQVNVALPSELDLYVVPAATRQVCTTSEWGFDEIRTDCRTVPIAVRRDDPALRGLCITRYGHRTCY